MRIPHFVEQIMHKCKNRRCKKLIIARGYCQECNNLRKEAKNIAKQAYTAQFIKQGKILKFVLPSI